MNTHKNCDNITPAARAEMKLCFSCPLPVSECEPLSKHCPIKVAKIEAGLVRQRAPKKTKVRAGYDASYHERHKARINANHALRRAADKDRINALPREKNAAKKGTPAGDRDKAKAAAYRAANREQINKRTRERRARGKALGTCPDVAYRAANREQINKRRRERRAIANGVGVKDGVMTETRQ